MAKLIGDKPNQVPTNADLGDLAYVDMDNIPSINVDAGTLVVDAATGRVGIGTSSPLEPLHVENINADLLLRSTSNTGNSRVFFGDPSSNVAGQLLYAHNGNFLAIVTNGGEKVRINSTGNVGIGTTAPTNLLDVNADSIRVRTAQTPASASAAGNQGEIAWDADYIYVCTATDTWKRVAIATW